MRLDNFKFAACAALLAVLPLTTATAKPAHHGVRASLGPGFSLAVPDGWMSCDAESNRLLGNADHPKVLDAMCARLLANGPRTVLVNADKARPILVLGIFTPDYSFPDEFVESANPETTLVLNQLICQRVFTSSYHIQTCDIHVGTVAGYPAFVGDATSEEQAGHKNILKFFLLSGKAGSVVVVLETPLPLKPGMSAYMDAIASTIHAEPTPPPLPSDLVAVTTAPGVSMSIPRGWMACDAANKAVLGDAPDPEGLVPRLCGSVREHEVVFFDPRPFRNMSIRASYAEHGPDADAFAKSLAPDALAQNRDADCAKISKPMTDKGYVLVSCATEAATVGGHPAKITTFVASGHADPGDPKVETELRVIDILYSQGIMRIQFGAAAMFKPMTKPEIDAVVNSLAIP